MSVANADRQAALWVAHTRTRRSNHEARTIAFLHSGALNGMHKTGREKERKGGTSHHILEKVLRHRRPRNLVVVVVIIIVM